MRWWSSFVRGLRRAVFCKEGGIRAIWKLILAYAAYVLWAYMATFLLAKGFGALFEAWNLNAQTISRAPGWARFIVEHYGRIISLISSAGAIVLSWVLLKWFTHERPSRLAPKAILKGLLVGFVSVMVGVGIFRLTDSMRALESGFRVTWEMLWLLAVYLLATIAEERFARDLALKTAAMRAKPYWAYIASVAMFMAITGSYALSALGILNMLLTGIVCARLSMTGRSGMSVGFRFAWSYLSNAIFCFPGGNAAQSPAILLYHVSDAWLTGGERGLISAAWMTLVLLALCIVFFWPQMRGMWAKFAAVRNGGRKKLG